MQSYIVIGIIIRILADFLLILGINRLSAPGERIWRGLAGAVAGGIYATLCMVLKWQFLRHPVGYAVSLLLTCLIAFGFGNHMRKWPMFCLLRLGLDGLGNSTGELIGAALLFCVCLYCFRVAGGKRYVPVELQYQNNRVALQALYDTGHGLTDPVTGKPVLVVGADVADRLTGLTQEELKKPVEMMGKVPGLRLIPCQTIGRAELMLALPLEHIRIGNRKGRYLVAFAPRVLDENGKFQGLIGGTV